jgi:hypothetical protein
MRPKPFLLCVLLVSAAVVGMVMVCCTGLVCVHKGNACTAAYQCQDSVFAGIAGDQLS